MGVNSFLRMFQPKDKVFYTLFENVSDNLNNMAKDLFDGMRDAKKSEHEQLLQKMRDYEHENDRITHEIFIELGKNFITPFDREDIHQLAAKLDDIADYMYSSTKYLYLYKAPFHPSFEKLAELIYNSTEELKDAIYKLRDFQNPKAVREACVKINSIENLADDIYSQTLAELFDSNGNVIDIIKSKSVLDYLETVTDKCEDAANIIESILIKYA